MDYLIIASTLGTIAFAFSGVLVGIRKKLDWVGVFILSILTANGGGVIRDLLIDRTPIILKDMSPFYIVVVIMLIVKLIHLKDREDFERKWLFIISDAVGLVAFAINGALIAIQNELSVFGVMMLAFLTSVGGGIVRDILVNQVPAILKTGFYGSVAVIVALLILSMKELNIPDGLITPITFIIAFTLRIFAYKFVWKIPKY